MTRSVEQTNRMSSEAVPRWFVSSLLQVIPHDPRKKYSILMNTPLSDPERGKHVYGGHESYTGHTVWIFQ